MKKITGVPASAGIAAGKALLHTANKLPEIKRRVIQKDELPAELKRLAAAYEAAENEMTAIHRNAKNSCEQADIFAAHIMMLQDAVIREQIEERISSNLENAEWVVQETFQAMADMMKSSGDPVFIERASDINEAAKQILYKLLNIEVKSLSKLDRDVILVSHDFMLSEFLTMDRSRVKGLATGGGGRTSHLAILAAAFEIPAVLGLSSGVNEIKNDDEIIIDGSSGEVIINPENDELNKYRNINIQNNSDKNEFEKIKNLPAETRDGVQVLLKANIEIPEEAEIALRYGASGIGLYRTEFLFLESGKIPSEDLQLEKYSKVFKIMNDLPVTIRTVDIGGDKAHPEFDITDEANPLLGWRAIRFSLARPDIFKTQLRAILRAGAGAGAGKNVHVMFPLVSGIEELDAALKLLDEAKAECAHNGFCYAKEIEAGVMIEVPSAAMVSDLLAEKAAFFSIGTNDLLQYTLAVDRGNEKVNYLAKPLHPAMIRFLKMTIDAAHKRGIKAAMCGEMAGDPELTPLLLGLGLDEFSMTSSFIPRVKKIIRQVSMKDCCSLAAEILNGKTAVANAALMASWKTRYA